MCDHRLTRAALRGFALGWHVSAFQASQAMRSAAKRRFLKDPANFAITTDLVVERRCRSRLYGGNDHRSGRWSTWLIRKALISVGIRCLRCHRRSRSRRVTAWVRVAAGSGVAAVRSRGATTTSPGKCVVTGETHYHDRHRRQHKCFRHVALPFNGDARHELQM